MARIFPFLLMVAWAGVAQGETLSTRNGTDLFVGTEAGVPAIDAPGDVFATGSSVVLQGGAAGDVHAMGFSVEVDLAAPQDLYVMGGALTVRAPVGSDLSAMGFSVRLAPEAAIGGNARLAGGAVTIEGPVSGALTAAVGEVTLNAEVGGDVLIQTGKLTLGPAARIAGDLVYSAPEPVAVPASVMPHERIRFTRSADGDLFDKGTKAGGCVPILRSPAFSRCLQALCLVLPS